MSTKLHSERVIVQSPMSFVGSYHRAMKIKSGTGGFDGFMRGLIAWTVLLIWWVPVTLWTLLAYTILLPLTIIWRMMRRSNRSAKQDKLRHREMMTAMEEQRRVVATPIPSPEPAPVDLTPAPVLPQIEPPAV